MFNFRPWLAHEYALLNDFKIGDEIKQALLLLFKNKLYVWVPFYFLLDIFWFDLHFIDNT